MENLFEISTNTKKTSLEKGNSNKDNSKFELFSQMLEIKNNLNNTNNEKSKIIPILNNLDTNLTQNNQNKNLNELKSFLESLNLNIENIEEIENIDLKSIENEISNELKEMLSNTKLENINTQTLKNNLILLTQNSNNYTLDNFNKDLETISKIDNILNKENNNISNIKTSLEKLLNNKDLNLKEISVNTFEVEDMDLDTLVKTFKDISPDIIEQLKKETLNTKTSISNIDNVASKYIFEQKIVEDKPKTIMNVFSFVKNIAEKNNTNNIETNNTKLDLKSMINNLNQNLDTISENNDLKPLEKMNNLNEVFKETKNIKNELKNNIQSTISNLIDNVDNDNIELKNNLTNLNNKLSNIQNLTSSDVKEVVNELNNIIKNTKLSDTQLNEIKTVLNDVKEIIELEKKVSIIANPQQNKVELKNNQNKNNSSNQLTNNNSENISNKSIETNIQTKIDNNKSIISVSNNQDIDENYSFFNSVDENTTFELENLLDNTISEANNSLEKNNEIENLKLKIVKSQVDQKDFINKIVDLIERKGKLPLTTLRIKLEPYSLGDLDIVLKSTKNSEQQNINIQIKASKMETLTLIENNKQLLKSQIEGKVAKNTLQSVNVIYDNKLEEENKKSSKK